MRIDGRLSRRRLVRSLAGGALTLAAVPALSACNDNDDDSPTANEPQEDDSTPESDDPAEEEETEEPDSEVESEETEESEVETEEPDSEDEEADATPSATNGGSSGGQVTIYSGRGQDLVQPILDRFAEETGIEVQVRYGDTAEMAAAILEEGSNTPADVYYGQDAGALGALSLEGMTRQIPDSTLDLVEPRFKSPDGLWIGTSGRARVVVYNTDELSEDDLPSSILEYADSRWENMLGWAPTNGSFQAWVTALRLLEGEDVARDWLEEINALNPRVYEGNTPIVGAAISGEIQAGFVNHYYLYREIAEAGGDVAADNYFFRNGDVGGLINIAGVAILEPSENVEQAEMLVDYLLQQEAQEYFSSETFEYPLAQGVPANEALPSLDELETPDIDLSDLEDLEGTLALLREVGLL